MNKNLEIILNKLPQTSGIYQFLNKDWKIIYIWKSIKLKSRISSYFNWKAKLNFAKQKMVEQIYDIKTILTNNETESLILETTLIKKHSPKYNILMKDWKNHIYIKITGDFIPKIIKTRIKTNTWTYFWPYISTNYVNNVLKLIKKIFWYRSCNIIFKEEQNWKIAINNTGNTKIPCMDFYIKKCSWPCLLKKENINTYIERIKQIKDFLNGNTAKIKQDLWKEMVSKAKELKFEEASKIKEYIDSIKSLEERQIVRDWVNWNFEIINFIEKFWNFYIWIIEIKDWKITWFYNFEIENKLKENNKTIIKSFVESRYIANKNWNIIYIIPEKISFWNIEIKTEIPKIWNKKELLSLCYKNIYEYAYKKHLNSLSTKWFSKKVMEELLKKIWFKQINKNIIFECNDISHISWNHTVASRSIIENWKSNTSKYKKFKIKTIEEQKIDDFYSMKEIIQRRIKEIEKNIFVPDLIVIDGWKWQLSSVVNTILELKNNENKKLLDTIQIISIAKKEEEIFLIEDLKSYENKSIDFKYKKILLSNDSNELRLLQKIRDEAHRFAISFNRDSRIKSMKKNLLESLPWFWPKTRTKILKKYWNIEKLKNINEKELWILLNKNQIETLKDHWII